MDHIFAIINLGLRKKELNGTICDERRDKSVGLRAENDNLTMYGVGGIPTHLSLTTGREILHVIRGPWPRVCTYCFTTDLYLSWTENHFTRSIIGSVPIKSLLEYLWDAASTEARIVGQCHSPFKFRPRCRFWEEAQSLQVTMVCWRRVR